MNKVALEGDWQSCPIPGHSGGVVIVSDPDRPTVNNRRIALVGDKCECGSGYCTIMTGSSTSVIEGRPVAIIGSKTDHGGTIVQTGDSAFQLE